SHAQMLADELEIDPARLTIELAPAHRAYDDPEFRIQNTGGSSSVRTSWDPLRKAGAVAREMLRRAAAKRFQAPLDEGPAEHGPTGRGPRCGDRAEGAAREPTPELPLKPASERPWMGKSVTRLDGRIKVDGSAVYGVDVSVPGLLTAVVLRPPRLGAEVISVD